MRCPHCRTEFFENWFSQSVPFERVPIMKGGKSAGQQTAMAVRSVVCPQCLGATVDIVMSARTVGATEFARVRAVPRCGPFPPAPLEVPEPIAVDYSEANEVLPISTKASAALSRRCLQGILSAHGYKGRDLVKQVVAVLAETDTTKALPTSLRDNVDAIRNFGNFSAHPVTDLTSLQVVEVEPGEAEWCLQLVLDLFDHYYVSPARAAEKRAALARKLSAAGKPPMKK